MLTAIYGKLEREGKLDEQPPLEINGAESL